MKLSTKKMIFGLALATAMLFGAAGTSYAYPTLQLDISTAAGYDFSTETIVTSENLYTINAYLLVDKYNTLDDMYYVSFSLTNAAGDEGVEETGGSFGSFSVDGVTTNVTADMDYGTAPLDAIIADEGWGDPSLPSHGVWPSYFIEVGFTFDSAQYMDPYNTQDRAIAGTAIDYSYTGGTRMYYMSFVVDTTNLDPAKGVHSDLYNVNIMDKNLRYKTQFAPFSHDAAKIPEPASLVLTGLGMLVAWTVSRKRITAKNAA